MTNIDSFTKSLEAEALKKINTLSSKGRATKASSIQAKAHDSVPVNTGNLKNSFFKHEENEKTSIGYSAPYAEEVDKNTGFFSGNFNG